MFEGTRLAKAFTKLRVVEDPKERVLIAVAHAPLVQIVQLIALVVEAHVDAHLGLVLVVRVGAEVRVRERFDDIVAHLCEGERADP